MNRLSAFGMAAALAALPSLAQANDTTAALAAGGLVFTYSPDIEMRSEDLYISPKEVRVDYVFRNVGDHDQTRVVAFPMPDIEGRVEAHMSVPDPDSDNFLNFTVSVDGKTVAPEVERHAFVLELDVTERLQEHGIPLLPYGDAVNEAIAALPQDVLSDWVERGILAPMEPDGVANEYYPIWRLKTTFWWRTTFPAGRDIRVAHRYTPSVGFIPGASFVRYDGDNPFFGEQFEQMKERYCFDDAFLKAVGKRLKAGTFDVYQQWITYVLTTGANWGGHTIDLFHLTVDKGDADALVSFCGDGVRKTGPTTFEMTAEEFRPERDLDILLLTRPGE